MSLDNEKGHKIRLKNDFIMDQNDDLFRPQKSKKDQ